jgi:eukaryotic-like serine/threonine-protein kinase
MNEVIGRFEFRRVLGQGAQAEVWLAFDPRLEREVAIKLMKPAAQPDSSQVTQWLQEARSVSRLTHTNIVPVFEADVQDNQPYLVFEYVPGLTLGQQLAQHGALAPVQAVAVMQDVLAALIAAHASGVVHRDLKPSNVLLDRSGRARVMDFGIAARISQQPTTQHRVEVAGTPAYMAPEAVRGESITPQMDIYSAGLLLAELLWGKPIRDKDKLQQTLQKISIEPQAFPPDLMARLDDGLRSALLSATAFEVGQRYPSAQAFLDDLLVWSGQHKDNADSDQIAATGKSNSTLEFLLRRMRNKSDFPALSESIGRIQSMASSEKESINSVTNEILKDVALTNKLLRLVNSVHYSRGTSVGTVSRAVSLVGFNGIRNMALSLVLLEHMQDKINAHQLKEEFLRALMAGAIAAALCNTQSEGEDAFIGALFQNLGRMLSQFYFPEEALKVRQLVSAPRDPISEEAAATLVLGLGYEALGLGVCKAWSLPESIQRCMVKPSGAPPSLPIKDSQSRLRWSTRVANEMADAVLHTDAKVVGTRLAQVAKTYGRALGMTTDQLNAATAVARKKLLELAQAMEITVRPDSLAAHLLNHKLDAQQQEPANLVADPDVDTLNANALHATQVMTPQMPMQASSAPPGAILALAQPGSNDRAQTLTAGVQDITNAMVEDFKLSDVLRMIMEAMFRALDLHRIVFCMRDPKTDTLTGRFGLGAGVEAVVKQFNVPLHTSGTPDLFATICIKAADTLISDASDPRIVQRLPAWYSQTYNAPTFLVLPLVLKGKPFGLIYADMAQKGGLLVDEKELSLLRTLRNQAVMAFKQST